MEKSLAARGGHSEPDIHEAPTEALLRAKLAKLLDVSAAEIDDAETFESLGIDRAHRIALVSWLETRVQLNDAHRIVSDAQSLVQLTAALNCHRSAAKSGGDAGASCALQISPGRCKWAGRQWMHGSRSKSMISMS